MFAENLKREMEAAGITPAQLVVRLQTDHDITVTAGAVDHWLAGRRSPGVATMQAVASQLNVRLDDLLRRQPKAVSPPLPLTAAGSSPSVR